MCGRVLPAAADGWDDPAVAGRTRAQEVRERVRGAAMAVVALGVLVYLYAAYHVLEAGGMSVSSELGACGEAATGRWTTSHRMSEDLVVVHGFFPPSATCRWSGGSEAVLVAPTWTWSGIVLVAVGLVPLLALLLTRRR